MRAGDIPSRIKSKHAEELKNEALFFGLPSLIECLSQSSSVFSVRNDMANIKKDGTGEEQTCLNHADETRIVLNDVRKQLENAHDALTADFNFLEMRRKNFSEMSQRLKTVHFSEVVKLNVGGKHFQTSISTLQRDSNSMLAAMFSDRFELNKQSDGAYFIDRDGSNFIHILNFLRTGKVPVYVIDTCAEELREEAEFYNIQGLLDIMPASMIKINVGGELFNVSTDTLNKHSESKLAKMLVGKARVPRLDGAYFFDRPNDYFHQLIKVMHDNKLDETEACRELLSEAEYYDVHALSTFLYGFQDSEILQGKNALQKQLISWLEERKHGNAVKLIYSAADDGWNSTDFHAKCDDIVPTISLMESNFGHIFGGFTVKSWKNYYGRKLSFLKQSLFHSKFFIDIY